MNETNATEEPSIFLTEKFQRLPKWAQDQMLKWKLERDESVKKLNEFLDQQTPSPFYMEELVCTGEREGPSLKTYYAQGHTMEVCASGICLRVFAAEKVFSEKKSIDLSWEAEDPRKFVSLIPESHQHVRLTVQTDKVY